jgi:hypothetical protein
MCLVCVYAKPGVASSGLENLTTMSALFDVPVAHHPSGRTINLSGPINLYPFALLMGNHFIEIPVSDAQLRRRVPLARLTIQTTPGLLRFINLHFIEQS